MNNKTNASERHRKLSLWHTEIKTFFFLMIAVIPAFIMENPKETEKVKSEKW